MKKQKLKTIGLWSILFLTLFLMIYLTAISVTISSPIPDKEYVLENVQYVGIKESSCHKYACAVTLKFKDENNVYQLTGHKHEMDKLAVNSFYNVYYDNFSKTIKRYDFPQN